MRNLKNTSTASSKLLLAAKSLVSDPNAPNAKNSLANAARSVFFCKIQGKSFVITIYYSTITSFYDVRTKNTLAL